MQKRALARFFRISIPEVDYLPVHQISEAYIIMEVEAEMSESSDGGGMREGYESLDDAFG